MPLAFQFSWDCPALGSMSSILRPLSDGDQGIAETVDHIREMVEQGRNDFTINQAAGSIVRNIDPGRRAARAEAIFNAVLRRVKFVEDIVDGETIRPAAVIWKQGFGDCDDINGILLPSMLMTVGYPVRLVTVAADPVDLSQFSHIYAEVEVDPSSDRWIPVDAARPGARFGREPERPARKHIWSLLDSGDFEVGMSGGLGVSASDLATLIEAGGQSASEVISSATGNYPAPPVPPSSASVFLSWPVLLLLGIGALAFAFSGRRR
jgi:hypothetical protein